MNTALNWLIIAGALISLSLGFILALRARRQFGFLAPLGFMCAVLLHRVCLVAVLPMHLRFSESVGLERFREIAIMLIDDDGLFYLGTGGHADGIWHLGAGFFLLCGLLDLKAASGGVTGKLRYALITGGTLLFLFSVIYPYLTFVRLR